MKNRGILIKDDMVLVEAGAVVGQVSQKTVEAGLTGFEWAVGLPGTVGGAVRGNAGMWGSEIRNSVESVWAMRDGSEQPVSREECGFGYRTSVFKREPGWVILKVALRLRKAEDPALAKQVLVKYLMRKKESQPVEWPSAGCAFQNWQPPSDADMDALHHRFDLNTDEKIPCTDTGAVPAGWIIDRLGLKGYKVGHASVSEKHANFLVSDGAAKAADVIGLISAVKMKVRNSTDGMVQLTEEIELVGF
jgi:UDP-N-acetylmuramate dehydrogenase